MEDRKTTDYYAAQRHLQSAMIGDTPVKTVQNRQYIDNVSDYDSERYRIIKSVCHKLDLGPSSLPGAQQHTTVETAAAIERQDNKKGEFKAHICHAHRDGGNSQGGTRHSLPPARRQGGFNSNDQLNSSTER